jgi:hypothetical protein
VDEQLKVTPPKQWATGVPAVTHALQYSLEETSIRRTAINRFTVNQANGVDCPSCAWPEPAPGKRHMQEYCENGAKHINDEATTRGAHSTVSRMSRAGLWACCFWTRGA